jgi:hypothetical protein
MNAKTENSVHAFIISWDGMHEKASSIANEIFNLVKNITVIYSNNKNSKEFGVGNWVRVDNEKFYGPKFKKCLDLYNNGIFLLIHADADCSDWKGLIRQCEKMNAINEVGVWAPNTYYTGWATNFVEVVKENQANISFVMQTDGIVFSLSKCVIERMRKFNYDDNNLGWGIDWAAISFSYCNNKIVIRDHNVFVAHQQGAGYDKSKALAQMQIFLDQLTVQEKIMYKLLYNHFNFQKYVKGSKDV